MGRGTERPMRTSKGGDDSEVQEVENRKKGWRMLWKEVGQGIWGGGDFLIMGKFASKIR